MTSQNWKLKYGLIDAALPCGWICKDKDLKKNERSDQIDGALSFTICLAIYYIFILFDEKYAKILRIVFYAFFSTIYF